MSEHVFRPKKVSYILYRSLKFTGILLSVLGLSILLFQALTIIAVGFEIQLLLDALLFLEGLYGAWLILLFLGALVLYKTWLWATHQSEAYFVQEDRVTIKKGRKRETLPFTQIRGIKRVYPLIETGLFSTGRVILESVDGEQTMKLRNLASPEELAGIIEKNMNEQGVRLTKDEKRRENVPATFFYKERFLGFLGTLTTFFIFYAALIYRDPSKSLLPEEILLLTAGLFLVTLLTWLIPDYFERSRRTYTLYNDAIEYKKGFFKKQDITYPLHHVESTKLSIPVKNNKHGYGTITLHIKGEQQTVSIQGIKNPYDFHDELRKALSANKKQ